MTAFMSSKSPLPLTFKQKLVVTPKMGSNVVDAVTFVIMLLIHWKILAELLFKQIRATILVICFSVFLLLILQPPQFSKKSCSRIQWGWYKRNPTLFPEHN